MANTYFHDRHQILLCRYVDIAIACADTPRNFGIMLRVAKMDSGSLLTNDQLKCAVAEYFARVRRERLQ